MKLILFLLILLLPISVDAISAKSAIVMDQNSNRILYSNNINEKMLIASTTKIMTALIAINYGDLEKIVEVDEEVLKAYGSAIYIEVGEKIKLKDLLYGLMLRSGNDAAIVIAKEVAGSMEKFVYLMNQLAMDIGMKNTIFINNHGLEDDNGNGNLSTAYDMAILMKYAMKNNTFKEISGTKNYKVTTNYKTYSWTNKNKILHSNDFVTGGKTGYTMKARRTLVTTASKDNVDLVIVTLNDSNDFKDHISLYNKYFEMYHAEKVLDKNNFYIENDYYDSKIKFIIKNDYYALVKADEKEKIKIKYDILKNKNVSSGEWIGTAKIYLGKELLHEENIFVEINKSKNKTKKSLWEIIKGWFK